MSFIPTPAPGDALPGTWAGPLRIGSLALGAHNAAVRFRLRFLRLVTVRGWFEGVEGTLEFDAEEPAHCRLSARVPALGIRTGNRLRDRHLRSHNWLDAASHPHIEFRSAQFVTSGGTVAVRGVVRMKGIETSAAIVCQCSASPFAGAPVTELSGSMTVRRSSFQVGPRPRGIAPWDFRTYLMEDGVHLDLQLRLQP